MKKFKITLSGIGSESTVGSITNEDLLGIKNEISENDSSLEDILTDYELSEKIGLSMWHDIDGYFHVSGVNITDCEINVEDANSGELVFSRTRYDNTVLNIDNVTDVDCIGINGEGEILVYTDSVYRGHFYGGHVETDVFDINKLKFVAQQFTIGGNFTNTPIIDTVIYDGIELSNEDDEDTIGKSLDSCIFVNNKMVE